MKTEAAFHFNKEIYILPTIPVVKAMKTVPWGVITIKTPVLHSSVFQWLQKLECNKDKRSWTIVGSEFQAACWKWVPGGRDTNTEVLQSISWQLHWITLTNLQSGILRSQPTKKYRQQECYKCDDEWWAEESTVTLDFDYQQIKPLNGSLYLSITTKFYTEFLHKTTGLTPN